MAVVKQNWRDVCPTIAHKSGVDWRLLSMASKTSGDIEAKVLPEFRCLKTITYVSLAKLQPRLSYEPHSHEDHEEIYYIIRGEGEISIGSDKARVRDGDVIYIPEKVIHTLKNDANDTIEFLAFGGYIRNDRDSRT